MYSIIYSTLEAANCEICDSKLVFTRYFDLYVLLAHNQRLILLDFFQYAVGFVHTKNNREYLTKYNIFV